MFRFVGQRTVFRSAQTFFKGNKPSYSKIRHMFATQIFHFPDDPRIVHYRINRQLKEKSSDILEQIIQHTTKRHRNVLLIGVEPSYLLSKDQEGKFTKPVFSQEQLFNAFMEKSDGQFRPHPGHIFMTLLDDGGVPDQNVQISLRPKSGYYHLKRGKTVLHPDIYGKGAMSTSIYHSIHTSYDDEVRTKSKRVKGFVEGHFTIIPVECSQIKLNDIRKNVAGVLAIKLYHLCMSIYKSTDINTIKDQEVRDEIFKLVAIAEKLQEHHSSRTDSNDPVIAAMACTHAVVKAIFGDSHHFEFLHGPDLDTQVVSTYLSMALTGNKKFFNFSENIGLFNFVSEQVQGSNVADTHSSGKTQAK